jgi:hypothetical protein
MEDCIFLYQKRVARETSGSLDEGTDLRFLDDITFMNMKLIEYWADG